MGSLDLQETMRERRLILAGLRATLRRSAALRSELTQVVESVPRDTSIQLLRISEALIAAHKVAKLDDDGLTLDLIEDAMRHVGTRLAREVGCDRNFSQKRLCPDE